MCLGVCARGTSQAPACFASIIHQVWLKAGENEQCHSLPQHFFLSAFFSLHLASRAQVVDAEPEACCKDDPVPSQLQKRPENYCWVFAKWRHSLARKYTPSFLKSKISSGFIINNAAVVRACFPPSCRMHSPPSSPRVVAQEAAQSRHTAGSRVIVARPGCPALASGARSDQISAPKSRTAAFSCDASRTRFHRGSHSSGKKKNTSPSKSVGTHLRLYF